MIDVEVRGEHIGARHVNAQILQRRAQHLVRRLMADAGIDQQVALVGGDEVGVRVADGRAARVGHLDEVDVGIAAKLLVVARRGLLLALVEVRHDILLTHLARAVALHVVHEHHVAGLLVTGNMVLAVRLHLGGREVRALARLDDSGHGLPHHRVARAEHEAVVDGGVRAQHVLHLGDEYVLAARFDHVLLARPHVVVPIRIAHHEVARAQPAVGRERLVGQVGLAVVALHHRPRPEQGLPHFAVGHLVAVLVHHLHLHVLHRPPHALQQGRIGL